MENSNVSQKYSTKRIVRLALFIAINMVATYIHIPIGASMMHLGTTTLFITALILNPMDSAIAAGGGMFLFDLLGGYLIYAPFTLVIKGIMAFIVAKIVQNKDFNGENIKVNFIAYIVGGIISVVGYYLTNVCLTLDFIVPLAKIPGSLLTTSIGIIIALPVGIQIKKKIFKSL